MIYFIVFGDISASLAVDFGVPADSFFSTRTFYVIIIALLMVIMVLKREI